uniref:Amino acid permease/ SLC12A domain-containing protein n=1 Tax=Parascaris univalens TaxID=6257 RepID=A0A914ZY65_PARUN
PFEAETTVTDVTTFDDTDDLLGDGLISLTPRGSKKDRISDRKKSRSGSVSCPIRCLDRRAIRNVFSTFVVQDDDAPYANGVLTTSVVIFLSYIQNCLMPAFLIVRLPWIVGFLGLWEFLLAVAIDLILVLVSACSVIAASTNGSDRFFGGPFLVFSNNFGSDIAVVATALLFIANCGFTAANCMLCAEMITRYVLHNSLVNLAQVKQLLRNNSTVLKAVLDDADGVDISLLYFCIFLAIAVIYVGIGKRVLKYFFWIPIVFFEISIAAITANIIYLKWNGNDETRCMIGSDQIPTSFVRTLNVRPVFASKGDQDATASCRKLFFKEIAVCFAWNNICEEASLSIKIITWSFDMVLSNVDANIASLVGLEFDDWRAIVYQYRIFRNVLFPNVHMASFVGCAVLMLPLFTGTVLGANIPSALAAPTKKFAKGIISALISLFLLVIVLGALIATGIERDLLLDKFGEGSIRRLALPLTVANPLFIVCAVMLISTAAAGQYMLTAKSLLLSLTTSHKFPVPRFFFYRRNKLRHLTTLLSVTCVVALFAAFKSVDRIIIVSGCTVMVALSVINFSAAVFSVFQFPSWKPHTRVFTWPFAVLGALACWMTAFVAEPSIISLLTVCSLFCYTTTNMLGRRYSKHTHHEFLLDIANMLLYTLPLSEFRSNAEVRIRPRCIVFARFPASSDNLFRLAKLISENRNTLCISLIRYVYDQEHAGRVELRASQRSMNALNLPGYATQFMYRKISSLHSVASALASCCALGAFHSNTVILDYPSHAALAGAAEQILYQYHMHRVCIRQCNLIMVKGRFQLVMKSVSSQCMIDIWWIIDSGDTLLLLAHILKRNGRWHRSAIRLFVVIELSDDGQRVEHDIKRWLSFNHLILHSINIVYMDVLIIHSRVHISARAQNSSEVSRAAEGVAFCNTDEDISAE